MANDLCVFRGQKPGTFRSTVVSCGGIPQTACRACEKELKDLDEAEVCRRALVRGLAENPDRIRKRIEQIHERQEMIAQAESHRPQCLRCGTGLSFMKVQELDNSPMRDSIFKEPFEVLPAYCENCGKYEFYNPVIVRKNKYLAYLIHKDTQG